MPICPNCQHRSRRARARCESCDHVFAFHRTSDMSDQHWLELINSLSVDGRYRFTINQLYIHWQRPRVEKISQSIFRFYFAIALAVITCVIPRDTALVAVSALSLFVFVPFFAQLGALLISTPQLRRFIFLSSVIVCVSIPLWWRPGLELIPPLLLGVISLIEWMFRKYHTNKRRFMLHLQQWQRSYKLLGLLKKPRLQRPRPALQGKALYDYEVRDILIVDQDLTVDFFVHNGFHEHYHLLIFSLQMYPNYMSQFANRLLVIHPDINVFLLHRDQRTVKEVTEKLKAIGVRRHRIIHLGWGKKDRSRLVKHLGFTPLDWDYFLVDTLPPHSLFEGVLSAIQEESSLISHLKSKGQISS